jgi:hypothetical protein
VGAPNRLGGVVKMWRAHMRRIVGKQRYLHHTKSRSVVLHGVKHGGVPHQAYGYACAWLKARETAHARPELV